MVTPHVPIRTCVGCRHAADKGDLVRIVRSGGTAWVDATGSAPGRGAYVHLLPDCVGMALRRGGVSRALRTGVSADELGRLRNDLEGMMRAH